MRVFDNGCFFTVHCTARDVSGFAQRWPCFGERRAIAFQFDKRNGDLVDILPNGADADMDGGGVCALADDAKAYGAKKLRLTI